MDNVHLKNRRLTRKLPIDQFYLFIFNQFKEGQNDFKYLS